MKPRRRSRGLYAPELLENRIAPATFIVTTIANDGEGSLRDAVSKANDRAGADTITFASSVNAPIVLTTGEILITDTLTIKGSGVDNTVLSGNGVSRIFRINDGENATLAPTTISGLTLTAGNSGINRGGALYTREPLSLTNVIVSDSRAGSGGGLGVISLAGKLTLNKVSLINNTATLYDGGGLHAQALGGISIKNTLVSGNTAGASAGGMYLLVNASEGQTAAPISITGSAFVDNYADQGGGALVIRSSAGKVTIGKSVFTGNAAEDIGGALYLGTGQFTITGSTFAQNSTSENGGALATGSATSLAITGSRFEQNRASSLGGALYLHDAVVPTITSSVFTGNRGSDGGAIAALDEVVLTVKNSQLLGNTASDSGGAIFLEENATLALSGSTLNGNRADFNGGALAADDTTDVTISRTTIANNVALNGNGGGVLFFSSGDLSVSGTLLQGNQARTGGAIDTGDARAVTISGTKVIGNFATVGDGGGMYLRSSTIVITNSIFSQNRSADDAGALVLSGATEIKGSRFFDNSASLATGSVGGAIAIYNGSAVELISSIVTGNVSNTGGGISVTSGTLTQTKSKITGNWAFTDPNLSDL